MADTMPRVGAAIARQQIEVILEAWGMPPGQVAASADILIDSDLKGIDSHGISMLMFYDQLYRAGQIDMKASPR
ncbi:Ldh family oxidoreductase, partial [Klebsiella pneumoniae]|nr:Ldh family oxidoreductase [Klebsiella pneumoniae]